MISTVKVKYSPAGAAACNDVVNGAAAPNEVDKAGAAERVETIRNESI